jgi:hypothetical protein
VGARGEDEQPSPVTGRDSRRIQGPVQRGQRLGRLPIADTALGERPVQVNEHVGIDDMLQRLAGHLLCPGYFADTV